MINSEETAMTKKIYNQPEVNVASIALESMILAGSASGGSDNENMNFMSIEGDQW